MIKCVFIYYYICLWCSDAHDAFKRIVTFTPLPTENTKENTKDETLSHVTLGDYTDYILFLSETYALSSYALGHFASAECRSEVSQNIK